jgi:general secretion pathway protein B
MSFILDALRKSEHERQRTAMPGIAQVPFGLPRREIPSWALGVIALLVVALLTLAGALWRSTWPDAERDRAASAPARNEVPLPLPSAPASESPAAFARTAPPDGAAAPIATAAPSAGLPEPRDARPAPTPPPVTSESAASFEPRANAPRPAAPSEQPRADRTAASEPSAAEQTLPSAAALAAQGVDVPTLHLELHAYADRPADRFVFINGTKYSEGATLAEGPRLVSIAPNGAVLSYLGHRFLLAPQ